MSFAAFGYAQVPETSETQSRDKFLFARVRSARVFAQIADIKLVNRDGMIPAR